MRNRRTRLRPKFLNHHTRVSFFDIAADMEVLLLGAFGLSTRAIATKTKYSEGQVLYRLKKAAVRRADYRSGTGVFAQIVLQNSRKYVQKELERDLVGKVQSGELQIPAVSLHNRAA